MPSLESVGADFAAALVSQAESAPARTILVRLPLMRDESTPLTTSDATRGAFASSLHEIDAINAPPVNGPYVPGFAAVSGPLTDVDIYDPSQLYFLPERGLVPFDDTGVQADGFAALRGATASQPSLAGEASPIKSSTLDTQAPLAAYFDQDGPDDESAALASRPVDLQATASHVDLDARVAFGGSPPQELNAVQLAAYLDLMRTGLFQTIRKASTTKTSPRAGGKSGSGESWLLDPEGLDSDLFDTALDETPRRSATGD